MAERKRRGFQQNPHQPLPGHLSTAVYLSIAARRYVNRRATSDDVKEAFNMWLHEISKLPTYTIAQNPLPDPPRAE